MGINYNIETEMCSLQKMCIVSVTQNILEIARHDTSTKYIPESIASKAAEMVSELDLPQTLNTEIVAILRPVLKELLRWYNRYGDVTRAIITPHGTVDMTKSARAIVASEKPVYQRYAAACEHCLEDDIFNLGKQVTSVMLREQYNPLANFWYNVYGGNFDVKIMGGSLSQKQVVEGWYMAGPHRNISAVRYFLEKATLMSIQAILNRTIDFWLHSKNLCITPALLNTCLQTNVLDGKWKDERKGSISKRLLLLLIKWPYQHLFLESAEMLIHNLSENDFFRIAWIISKKFSAAYKEYDYKGLFVRFWNLGLTRFKGMLLDDSEIEIIEPLLKNLVLVKDEFLVSRVFDQVCQMDKDNWYNFFNLKLSNVCFGLFHGEEYESVEFLLRLIRTKYWELFTKFQNAFNDIVIGAVAEILHCFEEEVDPIIVDKYVKFMSKYWVLPELELSGKNDLV